MAREVVVTGIGVMSPIGRSVPELTQSLIDSRSGIRAFQAEPLLRPVPAGVIPDRFETAFTKLELPFLDRCQQLAILAARQAIHDAGLDDLTAYGQRCGLYYGNVNGGVASAQAWYQQLLVEHKQSARPFSAMAIMGNAGAGQVSIRHGIRGPVVTHASACGSSGTAISEAFRSVRDGYLDIAIAGGAEAPLVASLIGVFSGTRAMAPLDPERPEASCRPFSQQRSGLVLGEGAAFLVLEAATEARARGARSLGRLAGTGISADAHHIGMPEARGQIAALRACLADADLRPEQIGYVNAHATATAGGDIIEASALREVFGDDAGAAAISSTKALHGHLIGATSALELAITLVAMQTNILPASAHLGDADPNCSLNHVGDQTLRDHPVDHAISFSCGFGGTNVAIAVSRETLPSVAKPVPKESSR